MFEYWGGSFYLNMLTVIRVHAWYLKQLVYPTPIAQYLGEFEISESLFDWRLLLSLVVVCGVLCYGFLQLNRDKLMAFAIFSYFVFLLPVSQLIPHQELLADHYLYLSMMSFGLFVSLLIERVAAQSQRARQVAYAAMAVAVVALAVTTILRNPVWKDDLTLWQTNYQEMPNSIRAASSLAKAYAPVNPGRSEELYKRCLDIDPAYWPAYYSLALIDRSRDKAREAEGLIRGGLSLSDEEIRKSGWSQEPSMFRSQMTCALALTRFNQGDADAAEQLYREAIGLNPLNPQPYTMLANLYRERDPVKAIAALQQLVAAYPGHREPLEQVATLLIEEKRDDEAINYLGQLLDLVPNDYTANLLLSRAYRGKKDCGRAGNALGAARAVALNAKEQREIQTATDELNRDCGR